MVPMCADGLFLPEIRRRSPEISTLSKSVVTDSGHHLQMRCSAPSLGFHSYQRVLWRVGFLHSGCLECPKEGTCSVFAHWKVRSPVFTSRGNQPSSPASTGISKKPALLYCYPFPWVFQPEFMVQRLGVRGVGDTTSFQIAGSN